MSVIVPVLMTGGPMYAAKAVDINWATADQRKGRF